MRREAGSAWRVTLLLALACAVLGGCSVGMAMAGKRKTDTSILFPGAPRSAVMAKLGPPETSTTNAAGERVETYLITFGNQPSLGRAAVHAGFDILAIGAWELVATPGEMGAAIEETSRYIITYDKDDKVKDVQAIKNATKMKPPPRKLPGE